jgi:hypothetical protein
LIERASIFRAIQGSRLKARRNGAVEPQDKEEEKDRKNRKNREKRKNRKNKRRQDVKPAEESTGEVTSNASQLEDCGWLPPGWQNGFQ